MNVNPPILHIGTYKTGTSSLQRFLRDHEAMLGGYGYRFPRGWLRRDNHLELHLAMMRLDRLSTPRSRKTEWRDPAFRVSLLSQMWEDLAEHPEATTIWSGEDNSLLRYDDELAGVRAVFGDATIICYWRDPTEWIASLTDQLIKAGIGLSDDPDAFNYVGTDSWQLDYAARTAAWRRHFTKVITLNYDHVVAHDGSVIPSFLGVLGMYEPVDIHAPEYWMNRRGEREQRVDGNRWVGLKFGEPLLPESYATLGRSSPASTEGSSPHPPSS